MEMLLKNGFFAVFSAAFSCVLFLLVLYYMRIDTGNGCL